ncbi:MAG TPA: CsgG/HfaB family protein [Kofleriaceae bacterium]|nr:CsgG/HfaB family protein [Kofleriaceae bacterium]
MRHCLRSLRRSLRRALPLGLAVCLAATAVAAADPPAPPTVAIVYFDYTGKTAELEVLRKGLAQMLISDLSGSDAIRVVERDRLEDILGELKLQGSAKIDPQSAVKLGKLLGARYLVLGGYFDLQDVLRVDARIVEVETGRVVKSFGTNGKPGDFLPVEQKVAADLGGWFGGNLPRVEAPHKKKPPRPPAALKTRTAVKYAEALAVLDAGDKAKAKATLSAVLVEQPDFTLASLDLDRLMK